MIFTIGFTKKSAERFFTVLHNAGVKRVVDEGCLLCSEDKPHHCHRRLVAEYLASHWGAVETKHLL